MTKHITGKPLAWLLTLIYFTSYMTRKNFATVLQQVIAETGKAKDTLSIVLVCMTIAYGTGQIINGRLGDKIKPTNLIFCGLIMATGLNLLFPFVSDIIRVMNYAHLVGFVVSYVQKMLKFTHNKNVISVN